MDFTVIAKSIPGCYEIVPVVRSDPRGSFVKTFHVDAFVQHRFDTVFAEEYYSVSRQGVLRGLHFQTPPMQHAKMVYCIEGQVLDAVVDIRVGSPTYGRYELFELDAQRPSLLYLPAGLAHGFYVRSATATMLYKVTSVYSPQHDAGILWSSVGIPWPDPQPLLSERDGCFPAFGEYRSPFAFEGEHGRD